MTLTDLAPILLAALAVTASPAPRRLWTRARRSLEVVFALAFASASLRLMMARLGP